MQEAGCAALKNLTANQENQLIAADKGAIKAVIEALSMHANNSGVQEGGCGVLKNLTIHDDKKAEAAQEVRFARPRPRPSLARPASYEPPARSPPLQLDPALATLAVRSSASASAARGGSCSLPLPPGRGALCAARPGQALVVVYLPP